MTIPIGLCEIEVPRAVVLRRIKQIVGGKPVQKEAKLALSKAVTVFISYLTTHALDENLDLRQQKSISPHHIYGALKKMGLGSLSEVAHERIQRQEYLNFLEHQSFLRERAEQRAANANAPSEPDSEGVDDEELLEDPIDLTPQISTGFEEHTLSNAS